jgi:hypothetical protein
MRFVSRFYLLSALAGCSILFTVHLLWASDDYPPVLEKQDLPFEIAESLETSNTSGTFDKRLVVFGDSWSDSASREEAQGPLWTEWLCSMVNKRRFHPVPDQTD